jgi:thiol:disulfide interchange protein DsbA
MTRAYIFANALAAAAIAGAFSLTACARSPEPAPIRLAQAPPQTAPIGTWRVGTNYSMLENPQPTTVAAGKIEVDEVFWYGCGHCYALDPTLEGWKSNKPAFIEFVRIPVVWGAGQRQHAKLYYTIQALGRADLHTKIFDAIHLEHNPLSAPRDEDARTMQAAFLAANGVSAKDFNAAYDSMSVEANVRRAQKLTELYAVASVPLIVVNGKYSTGVGEAGGPGPLLSLINDLAASEKAR